MSLFAMLAVMGQVQAATPEKAVVPLAAFINSVKAYTNFVTPHCASEETDPYHRANNRRDVTFKKSLHGTALEAVYRTAVRDQEAQDQATIYECFGPPPPPPPLGMVVRPVDPRSLAITEAQRRLRSIADSLPAFFDRGDALFADMIAARDQISARDQFSAGSEK